MLFTAFPLTHAVILLRTPLYFYARGYYFCTRLLFLHAVTLLTLFPTALRCSHCFTHVSPVLRIFCFTHVPLYTRSLYIPRVHTHPCTHRHAAHMSKSAHLAQSGTCTFLAQSGVTCLLRGVYSQRRVLNIAYVTSVKCSKQPLCARQTVISWKLT